LATGQAASGRVQVSGRAVSGAPLFRQYAFKRSTPHARPRQAGDPGFDQPIVTGFDEQADLFSVPE